MKKFVIKTVPSGVKFDLHAANHEIIASSEVYASKETCHKGIESVRHNAPIAALEDQTIADYSTEINPKFEVYLDKAEHFRFRLKARNGQNIVASQAYVAKASCLKGIESVRHNAADGEIDDLTT